MNNDELTKRQEQMKKLFRMATRKDYNDNFKRSMLELNPSISECNEVQAEPDEVRSPSGKKILLDMGRFNDDFSKTFGV